MLLCQRLKAEISQREDSAPDVASVRELITGRDWLFADDFYHIDISHLGAVVQMSIFLPPDSPSPSPPSPLSRRGEGKPGEAGEELAMARELCEYGKRLSPRFLGQGEPPFENHYQDYAIYLAALTGESVEEGINHFRAKADKADPEKEGTRPAEVLVNLLLRLGRSAEALSVARRHLASVNSRPLGCPSIVELCQRTKDYRALADIAREQGDLVHFVAGLVAGSRAKIED